MQWMTELSQFNFVVHYRPGKASKDRDYLRRNADYADYRRKIDMQVLAQPLKWIHSCRSICQQTHWDSL